MRLCYLLCAVLLAGCATNPPPTEADRLLIFGASGRIGGALVEEALLRGYQVTGVTRDPTRLAGRWPQVQVETGDILDRNRVTELAAQHDAVLVSIGGDPAPGQQPERYIATTSVRSLLDVLEPQGSAGPRMLFVGNLYTLDVDDGKTLIDLGRAAGHKFEVMFRSHQIALDLLRASSINWTVATPPNGLRLEGRTGQVRWGTDQLLREADGTPSTISPEDFAYAVLEELERGRYVRQRFTVARDTAAAGG
ncbi:MAG: NAD(P)H-binding protein [Pseudomonadota bacterium]